MMTTPAPTRPTRTIVVLVVVSVLLIAAAGYAGWWLADRDGDDSNWSEPTPTGEPADDSLAQYYEQDLDWDDCGRAARCTQVTVPVDYQKPSGETLELAVRLYPATDGKAERTLFVNPGGPGGSAQDYAASMSNDLSDPVRAMYDVVGVDPRGVGESTPLKCLDDAAMDDFVDTDPDPDDKAETAALRDSTKEMGEACAKNSGDLASHVSTEEAARDMDVVRALMGRDELDWFGASYGTQLGATYAHLFPDKVGRMILDGAVDPSADAFEGALGQATGFQRAFDAYAENCAKQSSCPVGSSVGEARAKVAALIKQLDQQPIKVGDRELTEGTAFYGIAVTLYSEETWDYLSSALDRVFDGDGSVLLSLSDLYFSRAKDGHYRNNIGQVIYAVNCLDADDRPTLDDVEKRLPEFEKVSPVFGSALGWGVVGCTDWPLTSKTPQGDVAAEGAPPIVVIGTTRDPATPYEWARNLADQLKVGVLVSRDGDGHTAFNSGNQCIDDLVEDFLVDGTVPKDDTMCKAE